MFRRAMVGRRHEGEQGASREASGCSAGPPARKRRLGPAPGGSARAMALHPVRRAARLLMAELGHANAPAPDPGQQCDDIGRARRQPGTNHGGAIVTGSIGPLSDLPGGRARRKLSAADTGRVPFPRVGRRLVRHHAIGQARPPPALARVAKPRATAAAPSLKIIFAKVGGHPPLRISSDARRESAAKVLELPFSCDICSC